MFFHEHLIVGYVHDPENERFMFQLPGGEEFPVTQEDFTTHWQEYRQFEKERAAQDGERYRPLPVSMIVCHRVRLIPANPNTRRKRKSA